MLWLDMKIDEIALLFYWIIPFALSIGVCEQPYLLSNSSTEVMDLLDPSFKAFSK